MWGVPTTVLFMICAPQLPICTMAIYKIKELSVVYSEQQQVKHARKMTYLVIIKQLFYRII